MVALVSTPNYGVALGSAVCVDASSALELITGVSLDSCTFTGNTAAHAGGASSDSRAAVYVIQVRTLGLHSCTFDSNIANNGQVRQHSRHTWNVTAGLSKSLARHRM